MCKCSVFHPLFCMSVYVHVHVCMCKCSQCMCMYMFACVNVLTVILTYNIHTNNNSPTLHQQLTLACARRAHSRTSTYFNWQIVCKACISSAMRVSESVLLQKLLAQTAGKNEDKEGFQTDIQRPPALPTGKDGARCERGRALPPRRGRECRTYTVLHRFVHYRAPGLIPCPLLVLPLPVDTLHIAMWCSARRGWRARACAC